jgi:ribosomal protein S18 acetylase RimI-like enzyme
LEPRARRRLSNRCQFLTVSQPPLDAAVSNEPHYNYLIYTDHKPCGYLRYAIIENDAGIESLYLEPSFRGKGIGTEALKQLEHLLLKQGVKRLSLTVLEKNIPGIKLYQKMGFEIRKHFFENGFSGIYMQKPL